MVGLIFPQVMLENLKKFSQLYHNPENSRSFFCSSRHVELCTQVLLHLHADATDV